MALFYFHPNFDMVFNNPEIYSSNSFIHWCVSLLIIHRSMMTFVSRSRYRDMYLICNTAIGFGRFDPFCEYGYITLSWRTWWHARKVFDIHSKMLRLIPWAVTTLSYLGSHTFHVTQSFIDLFYTLHGICSSHECPHRKILH